MANGHGGQRTPRNPAPVSGPGALSRRTDGKQPARWISGDQYGEGVEMMNVQTSAPMSESPKTASASKVSSKVPSVVPSDTTISNIVPLFAPTSRPDEPITSGMPFGAGPGPVSTGKANPKVADTLAKLLPYDDSGYFESLYRIAVKRGW